MSTVTGGPGNIVTNGLILYLDAANTKSYDRFENLSLNSEAVNIWTQNGGAITRTANTEIAPNGTLTADTLAQSSVTAPGGISRWVSSTTRTYLAGVTYTLSIWLKKVSGSNPQPNIWLWVNGAYTLLPSNTVGTITNEWVRYTRTFTPGTTVTGFSGLSISWNESGQPNDFVFAAWGFQIEIGSSATDYFPTTSTIKLRGTTWSDLLLSGNNGILTGGPTFNNANGGSIVFDGTDDHINWNSDPLTNLTNITYDCWFRFVSTNKNSFLISSSTLRVYQQNDAIWFITLLPFGGSSRNTQFNWIYNQGWNNLVYSFNGTTNFVYLNGIPVSTTAGSGTTSQNINLRISGRSDLGAEHNFRGNIASTKIYNRALSAAEVLQNYNIIKNRFGL
jgi:hypothetical protein